MTRQDRTAASECVRLMAVLAEAKTPHAKELATIVAARLLAVVDNHETDPLPEDIIDNWAVVARELLGSAPDKPNLIVLPS